MNDIDYTTHLTDADLAILAARPGRKMADYAASWLNLQAYLADRFNGAKDVKSLEWLNREATRQADAFHKVRG